MKVLKYISISFSVLFALLITLVFCSCSNYNNKNDNAKTIGISMPSKTLECWSRSGNNLKRYCEARGYNTRITYADNKVDQQVKDLESLIPDVDLLIVCPIDSASVSRVVRDAEYIGIPVIAYDRLVDNADAIDYYISFDNFLVGAYQGQYVLDQLGLTNPNDTSKSYNIEFIAGEPSDKNSKAFYDGQVSVLGPYIDSGVLKVQSGQKDFYQCCTKDWDRSIALSRIQTIISTYYSEDKQLDAVISSNDAVGIVAVQSVQNDYNKTNKVLVTGQDGDEISLRSIQDGYQSMTIYKPLVNQATVAADVADYILQGKTPDESLIKDKGYKFDIKYYDTKYNNGIKDVPSYILTPMVVTKENLKEKLIDGGYFEVDDDGYPVFPDNAK